MRSYLQRHDYHRAADVDKLYAQASHSVHCMLGRALFSACTQIKVLTC